MPRIEMSGQRGKAPIPIGEWIAGLGGVCLLVTLFRPWYELNVPEEFLSQARGMAPQMGEFGSLFTQGLEQLERQGPITVTAWQVFESADVVLAALAAAVLAAVALNAAGALRRRLDGYIALLGSAAAALVAFKLLSPPGATPGLLSEQLLQAQPVAYGALIAALAMVGGGMLALNSGESHPTADPPPNMPAFDLSQARIWNAS